MVQAIVDRARSVRADSIQGRTALRVLPILGPSSQRPEYVLLEGEALEKVTVTEVSQGGSVPELRVKNGLDRRVFLMDGQELVGAKQNRILNTDVLVPAGGELVIPVSCVEAGRWRPVSSKFSPGRSASHRVRSRKNERVHESLRQEARHDANQHAVWEEVNDSLVHARASSPTAALHDAYVQRQAELDRFRSELRMPEGAVGLAVFHGKRWLGLDLFDRYTTLVYFWQSLLESYAIDWLLEPAAGEAAGLLPEAGAVREAMDRSASGNWEGFASPGEGRDYRLNDATLSGTALVWEEETVVHLQLFPRESADPSGTAGRRVLPRIHRRYGRRPGGGEDVIQ